MADNYLWDNNPSSKPTSDFENHSPAANVEAPPNNIAQSNSFSFSKAVKLALGLTVMAGAVVLGVVLGPNSGSDKPEVVQAASSVSLVKSVVAENYAPGKDTQSTEQEFYTSSGLLEAKIKMVSSSVTEGYDTCSDLEKDITEALKLYISNYISSEAENPNNEIYANCDPDNENWMMDYYGYDYYYYNDYSNEAVEANETVTGKKKMPKSSKKRMPKSSKKQNRSSLPLSPQKQTRSSNQSGHTQTNGNGNGANKPQSQRSGGTEGSGFEQNSQNDNVNKKDMVVSDGSFIYAAYGDVLQVWSADGSTDEISITQMPGEGKDCDRNPLEPCTSKPFIGALILGNGRLTVVVTQYMYGYGATDQTQPIITDYGDKLAVVVYDISTVTLGLPLNELAYKELTGRFLDGGSIGDGDKAVIATFNYVDTWFTEDVSRSQSQYCGLNTTAYIELAKSTAESQIASFAKQMATELELVYNCSGIVQVSTMQDGSIDNARNLTGSDFLLGSFVQLFTLNVSSADGDIPATVSGLFTPSYGSDLYLTEDFIALPLNIYDDSIFILGFGLSADGAFKPFSYGHIPGEIYNLYRMDKKDGYLRFAFGYIINDEVTWATTYHSKIYVLELPSTPGAMTLVGESNLFGEDGHFVQSSRFSGDLAFLSGDDYENESQFVVVVDLSNPSSPKALGSLQVDCSLSYLQEIDVNGESYILGIGSEWGSTSYESSLVIALIDVSTLSEPKLAAYHKFEPGSSSDARYDFLSVRYFDGSLIIPVSTSKYNETTCTDTFVVYDISETTITPAFNVTHSTYSCSKPCYYDEAVPPRSFVINSELTTVKGHTAIRTDMAGNVISELDLDKGFNFSFCPDYNYYDMEYYY